MFRPLFFFLVLLGTMSCSLKSQEISLMTYNIRLDIASDGKNAWQERKDVLVDQIQFLAPDIFGIQEGTPHQTEYLKTNLRGYGYIGNGRDGGKKGEYSAIYYDTDKYTVSRQRTFWLSETPEVPSKGWDAAYPRICTYGMFTSKTTGERFWVFNTHLDHKGETSRKEGLSLIQKRIKTLNTDKLPVVLMGDFNTRPDHKIIRDMNAAMIDSREIAEHSYGPEGTFNGFKTEELPKRRIDYIFISRSSGLLVRQYAVLSSLVNLKYPSDHFPVYVRLSSK